MAAFGAAGQVDRRGFTVASRDGHGEEFALARLDFVSDAEAAQTRDQVRAVRADARPPGRHEGADASGSIWVAVDGRGRVLNVDVSGQWRQRLAPGEFAGGLFAAYTAAVHKALTAAAVAALAGDQTERDARGPSHPDRPVVNPAAKEPVDQREWLTATWARLDDIGAELNRLSHLRVRAGTDVERVVSSPHGHLAVRLRGTGVAGIVGDARRIQTAGVEQLRLEAQAVFRAAGLTSDELLTRGRTVEGGLACPS